MTFPAGFRTPKQVQNTTQTHPTSTKPANPRLCPPLRGGPQESEASGTSQDLEAIGFLGRRGQLRLDQLVTAPTAYLLFNSSGIVLVLFHPCQHYLSSLNKLGEVHAASGTLPPQLLCNSNRPALGSSISRKTILFSRVLSA